MDLARFVVDAVLLDGGHLVDGDIGKPVFTLRVPPAWTYGLDQLPGYDSEKRLVRLTTDIDITADTVAVHGLGSGLMFAQAA